MKERRKKGKGRRGGAKALVIQIIDQTRPVAIMIWWNVLLIRMYNFLER